MLTLIESRSEKRKSHNMLNDRLVDAWPNRKKRLVVWRPNSLEMSVVHNGKYWFGWAEPDSNDTTPRYWNSFGLYRENGNLQIAVEINIPTTSDSKRVAGFFAKDTETGVIYLMHDGSVGGGRKGVGRASFLAWSDSRLVAVVNSKGDKRPGIVVAPINKPSTASDIARFVQKAVDFKQAVVDGVTDSPEAQSAQRTYEEYYDEFTGKKRKRRVAEIEYISRHGDVVRALCNWRKDAKKSNQKIVKNAYIDLGVQTSGILTEIYEVKTSCDRQCLYTAIGQILVHDESETVSCQRFLVLPREETIPDDVLRALTRAKISLVYFDFEDNEVIILDD
jgi:hypothetical protein